MKELSSLDIKHNQLRLLVQAIQLLAMEYSEICRFEPEFVDLPEELELGIRDPLEVLDRSGNMKVLRPEELSDINQLLNLVDKTKCSQSLWTRDAIDKSNEWRQLRNFAASIIEKHGWQEPPSRDEVEFTRNGG